MLMDGFSQNNMTKNSTKNVSLFCKCFVWLRVCKMFICCTYVFSLLKLLSLYIVCFCTLLFYLAITNAPIKSTHSFQFNSHSMQLHKTQHNNNRYTKKAMTSTARRMSTMSATTNLIITNGAASLSDVVVNVFVV
jgi:hypothetical protein